jgi:glycolate oxidase FAD binding subunit
VAPVGTAGNTAAGPAGKLAADLGGHATMFRRADAHGEVFQPLPAGLLALHKRLKAALDPAGILNPGRLYRDL